MNEKECKNMSDLNSQGLIAKEGIWKGSSLPDNGNELEGRSGISCLGVLSLCIWWKTEGGKVEGNDKCVAVAKRKDRSSGLFS